MRANCETDLARQFPLAIVAKWLGNTQAVAMRHYVDVTDADFERAVTGEETYDTKAAQKAAQHAHAMERNERQTTKAAHKKPRLCKGPRHHAKPCKPGEWRRRESNPQASLRNSFTGKHLTKSEKALAAGWQRFDCQSTTAAKTDAEAAQELHLLQTAWPLLSSASRRSILQVVQALRKRED
jgi:hypothetical protein